MVGEKHSPNDKQGRNPAKNEMSKKRITFWGGVLSSRSRKKIRGKKNLRLFYKFINELTSIDANSQIDTESDYLFAESKRMNLALTKGDIVMLDVRDQVFRVLGRLAVNLPERYRNDIVIMPFEDLKRGYENYLNNPKDVKKNQISRFKQELIVDIALVCLTWSCEHITWEMNNLGFLDIKEHHVQSVLSRNYIPTSENRISKGFPWSTFIELLKWLNSWTNPDEDDKETKSSRYYKMHKRLTDFIDNIALDPELVARNLYARLENDILREMCRRKKVKLSKDTARELVGDLVKVKSITKNAISLLSPWQIVTYSKELFGQQFVGLRSEKKKTSRTIIRKEVKQAELRKIMDLHPNWGRKQLYKAMAQKFKGISQHLVNDMLYDMGFWETPKSPSVIRWKDWIKKFEHITWAGDFFCVQVFTEHGPKTYYVLFFIHLESDLLFIAGISPTATAEWVKNTIKRWTEPIDNPLNPFGPDARFLIRDRDRRYTKEVDWYIAQLGLMPIKISPSAPVMNCHAESFVNRIRRECLGFLFFFSEKALLEVIRLYAWYYNNQRPNKKHEGHCVIEDEPYGQTEGKIERVDLIPGTLIYYHRVPEKEAA